MLSAASARKSPRFAGASANPTRGRTTAPQPRVVRQRTQSDPGPASTGPAPQAQTITAAQATTAAYLSDQAQANAADAAQRASANAADAQLLERIERAIAARPQAPAAARAATPAQPSSQAQTGTAHGAPRALASLADAQLLERIEAAIAARAPTANPRALPAANPDVTDLTATTELTGTVSDIGILAERLASGMLLAATRPETIPALLLTIAARHHPTVSGYITTVAHTFGLGHTTPSFSNLLAALNTISRCAGQIYNADAYLAINAATDDVKFCHAKLKAAVEPASIPLHETALTRRIIDGLTDPSTGADCTIASLAAEYTRKAIKRADDTKLKGFASRPPTHAPTYTYPQVPQHPAPTTGTGGRGNPGGKGPGRGQGKGGNSTRLPYFKSAALNRDTRIPTDANGNNVAGACALCGKGLLPGSTGHRASACPADRNTQDNWVYAGIPAQ